MAQNSYIPPAQYAAPQAAPAYSSPQTAQPYAAPPPGAVPGAPYAAYEAQPYDSKAYAVPPQQQQYFPPPQQPYPGGVAPQGGVKTYQDPCLTVTGAVCALFFGFLAFAGFCCIDGPRRISFIAGLAIGLPIEGIIAIGYGIYYSQLMAELAQYAAYYGLSVTNYAYVYIAIGGIHVICGALCAFYYFKLKKTFLAGAGAA